MYGKHIFVVLCLTFVGGYSLDCYQCKGSDNNCFKDVDPIFLKTCENQEYRYLFPTSLQPDLPQDDNLVKSEQNEEYRCITMDAEKSVYRSCAKGTKDEFDAFYKKYDGAMNDVSFCTSDKCNLSTTIYPTITLFFTLLLTYCMILH